MSEPAALAGHRSLRSHLLRRLLPPLLALFAVSGTLSYLGAAYHANTVHDRWLVDSAEALAQRVMLARGAPALDLPEAAAGVLKYAQKIGAGDLGAPKESLLSKLANWDEALELYQRRLAAPPPPVEAPASPAGGGPDGQRMSASRRCTSPARSPAHPCNPAAQSIRPLRCVSRTPSGVMMYTVAPQPARQSRSTPESRHWLRTSKSSSGSRSGL
jgi:hypothetical protein